MNKNSDKVLLSVLTAEIDNIFLKIRKADLVIRQELLLLSQAKFDCFKKIDIPDINGERLKEIINKIPLQNLSRDEYLIYMLDNESSSIFQLLEEYNCYLDSRKTAQEEDYIKLRNLDEQLCYCIRRLGAMIYHLNSHLNLLTALLINQSIQLDKQQVGMKNGKIT